MIEESNTLLRYTYIVCEDAILRYTLPISERTKFDDVMSRQLYKRTDLFSFLFHVFVILDCIIETSILDRFIWKKILSRIIFSSHTYEYY